MNDDWVAKSISEQPEQVTSEKLCIFTTKGEISKDIAKTTSQALKSLSKLVKEIEQTYVPWFTLRSSVQEKIANCTPEQIDKIIAIYEANKAKLLKSPFDQFTGSKSIVLMGSTKPWPVQANKPPRSFGSDFGLASGLELTANCVTTDTLYSYKELVKEALGLSLLIISSASNIKAANPGHSEFLGAGWEALESKNEEYWEKIADHVSFTRQEADPHYAATTALEYVVQVSRVCICSSTRRPSKILHQS